MPTSFEFLYDLTTEDAQNEILNAIAAAKKQEYAPYSYFFTEELLLATADPANAANVATDKFGPIGTGTTAAQYRTTSVVRAQDPAAVVKVFAICAGQLLIQPADTAGKVNLILKPSASYNPLKIKYFIYRGVNKADLIGANILQPVDAGNPDQPAFLRKLWDQYIAFNQPLLDAGIITAPLDTFPAFLIGYDEDEPGTTSIEHYFSRKFNDNFYQIPTCSGGEHLGNFTGFIGLDVVLDYGDYALEYQDSLFKLDLAFARKDNHVLDTSSITGGILKSRYRENAFQFLDASAFWGSHIDCGNLRLPSGNPDLNLANDVFAKVLDKYQTKHSIYVYVKADGDVSYNYDDSTRTIEGFTAGGEASKTSGWPILIKEIDVTATPLPGKKLIPVTLGYTIDTDMKEVDRCIALDVISPNNTTAPYPSIDRPKNPKPVVNPLIGRTAPVNTVFQMETVGTAAHSCATFLMINSILGEGFNNLKNYYNELWPVNLNTNFHVDDTTNLSYWCTFDKSRLLNLSDILGIAGVVQNKIVFDNGLNQAAMGPNPMTKKRRLYMAALKRNSTHSPEYDQINVDTLTAGISKVTQTTSQYAVDLYNDADFSVYKGSFSDGTDIGSLNLIHKTQYLKKEGYFNLGITEEEYNKLIFDNPAPVLVPPATVIPQILPLDADRVYFYLQPENAFANSKVSKYKLGLQFEDNMGNILQVFPSTSNTVYVYSIDGFYFSSKEHAEYQQYFEEFSSQCQVDFRPKNVVTTIAQTSGGTTTNQPRTTWSGKHGFDWLRDNNTGMTNDAATKTYNLITGHYYLTADLTKRRDPDNTLLPQLTFTPEKAEWNKSLAGYQNYPLKSANVVYAASWLSLYPSLDKTGTATAFPKATVAGTPKCLTSAPIVLKILVQTSPSSLKIKYEKDFFQVTSVVAGDTSALGDITDASGTIYAQLEISNKSTTGSTARTLELNIKSLKEFSVNKKITVTSITGLENEKVCGELWVAPNEKNIRQEIDVAFVSMITKVPGRTYLPGTNKGMDFATNHPKEIEDQLTPFFNQALIDIRSIQHIEVDSTPGAASSFNPSYSPTLNSTMSYSGGIFSVLPENAVIDAAYNDMISYNPAWATSLKDFYLIFYINEGLQSTKYGRGESIGNGRRVVVYGPGLHDTTSAHELLHTTGQYHTFSDNNELTRVINDTDNIMDYSDIAGNPLPIPVVAFYRWQWKTSKAQRLMKPEK